MRNVFLAIVMALLVVGCASTGFEYEQADNMVGLRWDAYDDVVVYEVQSKFLDGEWFTLGLTIERYQMFEELPVGVLWFRVIAWLDNGSRKVLGTTGPIVVPPVVFDTPPPVRDQI